MDKFSEIERFRNIVKGVHRYTHDRGLPLPVYDYIGTVKLHGTNAGIRRTQSGKLQAQSRSRILDVSSDNYGFAQFVENNKELIHGLISSVFGDDDDVTVYGEWCGGKIQSNVALVQLDPHLVLFNAKINGEYNPEFYPLPVELQANEVGVFNIFQIPHYNVTVDFSNPTPAIDEINQLTDAVEECCPWGKFRGVEGIGEGIVWVPREVSDISDLWFKTKGGKHSGKGKVRGIKAKISVEKANSIQECLELVLPEWRLQQGIQVLKEMHCGIVDSGSIGEYLKWVSKDIMKEELDTITENGLEWKDVVKHINVRARNYILSYLNGEIE